MFGALATRAGLRGNFPGQATLAAEARCSERKVRDALRELEELGVVERVRRTSKRGYRQADGYRLMDRPLDEDESLAAPDAGRDHSNRQETTEPTGTSEQIAPLIEVDRSEVDNPQTPKGGEVVSAAAFDAFWSTYPRKAGKATARKAFEKAVERAGNPTPLLDGARRLRDDPNLPEKRFIPHPATWLNGDRWEDEPLPPRAGAREGTAVERMAQRIRQQEPRTDDWGSHELGQ